ncbi:ribonuclease III [Patescibacteria group bacterium]
MTLKNLEKKLGLKFKNPELLAQALVHRSYLNEATGKGISSNERLEFLGDAVLELVISQWLYNDLPHYPEGVLTNLRSNIVRTSSLAKISQDLEIGSDLLLSKGEKDSQGHQNPSILADTLEAIIGAIFLDQGIKPAQDFIKNKFGPLVKDVTQKGEFKDAKSRLQEKVQAQQKMTPIYQTIEEDGPDHDKVFTVGVYVDQNLLAKGKGKSKQLAEEAAAQEAFKSAD